MGGSIGQALFLKDTNHVKHLRYKLCGTRFGSRSGDAQCIKVFVHGINHAICQGSNGFSIFNRPLDDFVVNVGDVSNVSDLVTTDFEPPLNHIKSHVRSGMPNMTIIKYRHAADVHPNVTRI